VLWPGQAPWTFLEHVATSTLCTILVIVSFSITVVLATSRISSRSKKGSICSFCQKVAAKELRFDRMLVGLSLLGITVITCISHDSTLICLPFGIALMMELLRGALYLDLSGYLAYAVSIPKRLSCWTTSCLSSSNLKHPRHIRRRSSRRRKFRRCVFNCKAFNVDKRVPSTYLVDFDNSAVATIICANSANIHICNDRNMFESMATTNVNKVVAMIGEQVNFPKGVGTVKWSW